MAGRRNLVFLTALALLVSAGFLRLGLWQLDRAQWKTDWLARWQAAEQAPPREIQPGDLTPDDAAGASVVRHVVAHGRWAEQPLILLDNRMRQGRAGFELYRILQVPDLPAALLVDLGWQAWDDKRTLPSADALRAASSLPANAALSGLLVSWPGQGLAMGEAGNMDARGRLLLSRLDRPAIRSAWLADSRQAILAPVVLKLDPAVDLGFERDGEALPNTLPPERHRGYAVQWFALATAVMLIYGVLLWKNLRNHRRRRMPPA